MVLFAPLNLISDDYPSFATGTQSVDIIICRNVTIYFDQDTTRQVIKRFHSSLSDNGWLIVGYSEPLATVYDGLFKPHNFTNTVVYRKRCLTEPVAPTQMPVVALSPPPPIVLVSVTRPCAPTRAPQPPIEDLLQAAKEAADQESWPTALSLLDQVDQQNHLHPHAHYLRALIFLHQGGFNEAILSLRRAVYCEPSYALAHYVLADVYQKQQMAKDAVRHWRLAQNALANLDPDLALPLSDDLTAGMLQSLIQNRLKDLKGEV